MSGYSLFPSSYECRAFGFIEGQEGLFYDSALNSLLRGKIIDHKLEATVVHDGRNQATGTLLCGFKNGYFYKDWDLQHVTWFPENINTYKGYLEWLSNTQTQVKQIEAYLKSKRLLEETLNNK